MIEIKLSQGAKPGLGGLLPAAKVTPRDRGDARDPRGRRLLEPVAAHRVPRRRQPARLRRAARRRRAACRSASSRRSASSTCSATSPRSWRPADAAIDFIDIDGGEGGTGAGPLVFTDHVALPFKVGFSRVYRVFAEAGLHEDVVFTGGGKLGFPENALLAFALGCDTVNVGREAMLSIGCIQAQRCHTGRCPTGVTTNNAWLQRGLDPALKSVRAANYLVQMRKELLQLEPGLRGRPSCARHARPPRARRRPLRHAGPPPKSSATSQAGAFPPRPTRSRSPASCPTARRCTERPRGRHVPRRRGHSGTPSRGDCRRGGRDQR